MRNNRVLGMQLTVVGVIVLLFSVALTTYLIILYSQQQEYQMASCTINEKGVERFTGRRSSVYKASFMVTALAAHYQPYQVTSYDESVDTSDNPAGQNAVLDHYKVGQTYPCWYDPSHPFHVVLGRLSVFSLINWVNGGGLLLGGLFLFGGITGLRKEKVPLRSVR